MVRPLVVFLVVVAVGGAVAVPAQSAAPLRDAAPYVVEPVSMVAGPSEDDTTLSFTVDEGCPGLPTFDHAALQWAADRLTVTALGTAPKATAGSCAGATQRAITVKLGRALGQRSIYDGAYVTPQLVADPPPPWRPSLVAFRLYAVPGLHQKARRTSHRFTFDIHLTQCGPIFMFADASFNGSRLFLQANGRTQHTTGLHCSPKVRTKRIVFRLKHKLGARAVWASRGTLAPKRLFPAPH